MTDSTQRVLQSRKHAIIKLQPAKQSLVLPIYIANLGGSTMYFLSKRLTDIVIGLLALLVFSPFMLLIAVLIKFDSAGPVFFSQKRMGSQRVLRQGKIVWELAPFTMFKFRTMTDGASADIHQQFMRAFIQNDEAAMNAVKKPSSDEISIITSDSEANKAKLRSSRYKIDFDPRVTRVGKFLRKTSLDELPQVLNVIMGKMSLVGPRPALPYEISDYQAWHMQRFAAYQGMTGYWQVTARSEVNFDKMVNLDIWYAKHQSLLLDLKIIFLTPFKVLKGKGAK